MAYENREAEQYALDDEQVLPTEYNKEMFAFKNLCLSLAESVRDALEFYEEREMVQIYEWYVLKTAKDYKQYYITEQMRNNKHGY